MVVYEKVYFEAYTNDQYIWHKNNIAQLYFILGRAELCWNFSCWLRDASDIHRFPTLHMVNTHFLLENLWISKPSLSSCTVLFGQMHENEENLTGITNNFTLQIRDLSQKNKY